MQNVMMTDARSLAAWRRTKPRGWSAEEAEEAEEAEDKEEDPSWDCDVTARFV